MTVELPGSKRELDESSTQPARKHVRHEAPPFVTNSGVVKLQLLCTNDTHSQMEPFEQAPYNCKVGGVARRATLFAEMRERVPATLTLDAGDHFTGQPFFEYFQGEAEMTVLAALGYSAAAIGNHDFDAKRVNNTESGLAPFKRAACKYAPNVEMLCGNVVDSITCKPLFKSHAVFEVAPGIKVGVAAVLGEQAFDVVATSLRPGLQYTDFLEAAKVAAEQLRALNCDVLVCLSHTGVDRGDRELAKLGLYDVIFSGHAHFYEECDALPRVEGPGERLGLLSQGFACGGGIAWAQLDFDTKSRTIVNHSSGIRVVDDRSAENTSVAAMISDWRTCLEKAMGLDEVLGKCDEDFPLPDKQKEQTATFSAVHAALQIAVREEFLLQLRQTQNDPIQPIVVIMHRYSASFGLAKGELTRGVLNALIKYNNEMQLCEVSGQLLGAMVTRNAQYAGYTDFLFMSGVEYHITGRAGSPVPSELLSKEQLIAGALQCSAARVFGTELDVDGWYLCILDTYVIDTLLAELPERKGGVREVRAEKFKYRDLVAGYLKRVGGLQRK